MTGPDPYRDPEGAGASRQPMPCEIDPHTRMGAVSLVVSDLSRSCEYYEQAIGHFYRHLTEHVEMLKAKQA